MDLAKALGIMGFGTARKVESSGGQTALDELSSALTRQMEHFGKKKDNVLKTEKNEERKQKQQDKIRDEIRTMHEAYQFLAKKYSADQERMKEKVKLQKSEGITDEKFEVEKDKAQTTEINDIESQQADGLNQSEYINEIKDTNI